MNRETAEPDVDAFPGPNARRWVEFHNDRAAPSEHSHDFVWDVTGEAHGPFVADVDGNVLLDFTCHIGAAPLGYNNEKILDRLREFDLVDPMKIAGQDLYAGFGSDPADADFPGSGHLMERLVEASSQYDMDTVFLSNSGAEAMENAVKIAHDHRSPAKYGVVFSGSFHGRTLGTLSLTKSKPTYTRHYPEISGIETVPFCDDRGCDASTCDCGFFSGDDSELRRSLAPEGGYLDPEEIAFVAMEPIQGVGGYRFPSDAFMQEVADVTAEYDIPLIVDEIQSGVGRTGEIWASDHYPIEPDVIASAKGLRVGATISRSDVFPEETGRLSSTWGAGDVIASAQGALTLDAIREHDLMDNATVRGRQFKETMRDADLPGVDDVRGKGLLLALQFDSKERRDAVLKEAFSRGLLTLACGYDVLRVLPPLDVTEREIDLGCDLLTAAIEDAA